MSREEGATEVTYDRFTDMARKVMEQSSEESRRLNHQYIGTEHILLGIARIGKGVAANVLKNLNVDLSRIRLQVEKIIPPLPDAPKGHLPQTPRAKWTIEYAVEESRSLNHNYVGTEHLLLGLMREQEGVACQVPRNFGLTLEDVREETLKLLGPR